MTEYERGVIDGRQMQVQSSVDKAVNAMAQRQWRGLTDEEIIGMYNEPRSDAEMIAFGREVEAKLKEKNNG